MVLAIERPAEQEPQHDRPDGRSFFMDSIELYNSLEGIRPVYEYQYFATNNVGKIAERKAIDSLHHRHPEFIDHIRFLRVTGEASFSLTPGLILDMRNVARGGTAVTWQHSETTPSGMTRTNLTVSANEAHQGWRATYDQQGAVQKSELLTEEEIANAFSKIQLVTDSEAVLTDLRKARASNRKLKVAIPLPRPERSIHDQHFLSDRMFGRLFDTLDYRQHWQEYWSKHGQALLNAALGYEPVLEETPPSPVVDPDQMEIHFN